MRKLILSTDWWTDFGDAVAMHLPVHISSSEGVDGIPLGIDRAATDFGTWDSEPLYANDCCKK